MMFERWLNYGLIMVEGWLMDGWWWFNSCLLTNGALIKEHDGKWLDHDGPTVINHQWLLTLSIIMTVKPWRINRWLNHGLMMADDAWRLVNGSCEYHQWFSMMMNQAVHDGFTHGSWWVLREFVKVVNDGSWIKHVLSNSYSWLMNLWMMVERTLNKSVGNR